MSRLDGSLALPKGARENGWEGEAYAYQPEQLLSFQDETNENMWHSRPGSLIPYPLRPPAVHPLGHRRGRLCHIFQAIIY